MLFDGKTKLAHRKKKKKTSWSAVAICIQNCASCNSDTLLPRTPLFSVQCALSRDHDVLQRLWFVSRSKCQHMLIISGCDRPAGRIWCFVDRLIRPIAQQQESYLKDSKDFINFIENCKTSWARDKAHCTENGDVSVLHDAPFWMQIVTADQLVFFILPWVNFSLPRVNCGLPWIRGVLPWVMLFCRELMVFCRELIVFCRELILFCRELMVFCRELMVFCRELILFCRQITLSCRELSL